MPAEAGPPDFPVFPFLVHVTGEGRYFRPRWRGPYKKLGTARAQAARMRRETNYTAGDFTVRIYKVDPLPTEIIEVPA